MAMYHIGVCKALYDNNILKHIKIISGTSAGSLIAALCCTLDEEELPTLFNPPFCNLGDYDDVSIFQKFFDFITKGTLMDINKWQSYIRDRIGDFTFKEAFDKTGKILNISGKFIFYL
jgi:predicted acylesterase/phospholipase RssA